MTASPLNRRGQRILQAIVAEYLDSGEPVGSRTITRRHDLGLSSATVRNVMADLEELGLLAQPHTSAGRVPTESGLRVFIDALIKVRGLSLRDQEVIRNRIVAPEPQDPAEVVQRASHLLAEITQHAAVIVAPDRELQRISQLQFLPMRDGRMLAVLVTADGRIENRLLAWDAPMDGRRLEWIHNYLNQMLSGMTIEEIRERVAREIERHGGPAAATTAPGAGAQEAEALSLGAKAFAPQPERVADIVITGQANLLDVASNTDPTANPGRHQLAHAKELLRTLEDKQALMQLLERTKQGPGIQVFLGAETDLMALSGVSVVAVSYGPDEAPIGALGVIGPMRMNYARVMSVVDFTAEVVAELLGERG